MAFTYPGLINDEHLDPTQKANRKNAVAFRGEYLELMVQLEFLVESCITTFISSNRANVSELLTYFLYPQPSFNYDLKVKFLQKIVESSVIDSSQFTIYFNMIERLIRLRNFAAHNTIDISYSEGIFFLKKTTEFRPANELIKEHDRDKFKNDPKLLFGDIKYIVINETKLKELAAQLDIAVHFLYYLIDLFRLDVTNRAYPSPLTILEKLFERLDKNLIVKKEKLGIWALIVDK